MLTKDRKLVESFNSQFCGCHFVIIVQSSVPLHDWVSFSLLCMPSRKIFCPAFYTHGFLSIESICKSALLLSNTEVYSNAPSYPLAEFLMPRKKFGAVNIIDFFEKMHTAGVNKFKRKSNMLTRLFYSSKLRRCWIEVRNCPKNVLFDERKSFLFQGFRKKKYFQRLPCPHFQLLFKMCTTLVHKTKKNQKCVQRGFVA
jgi:hypothetical protein